MSTTFTIFNFNNYVFGKISELLNNNKLIKDIVANINSTRKVMVDPSKKATAYANLKNNYKQNYGD